MQVTHNNHFVPQSYLRRWSEDGHRIWCYRLVVPQATMPEWQLRPVRGVAYQRDLYTSPPAGALEVDEFEKWIEAEFETPAQSAIERAIHGDVLSSSDWERLVLYLAAQDVRTPQNYIESVERWNAQLPEMMQKTLEESVQKLEDAKRTGRKPEIKQSSEKQRFADILKIHIDPNAKPETNEGEIRIEVVAGRRLWLESQRHLLENTAKILLSHKWSIVEAANDVKWFTSDHPVARVNYYKEGNYDLKGGWGKKHGNLLMPLSPKCLLFTEIGEEPPRRFILSDKHTSEIIQFIAERAHRVIFACKPVPDIKRLRPRVVNSDLYEREQKAWRNWHDDQNRAEQN